MQITADHVGSIIRTNQPPIYIQIEAVSDSLVEFLRENGHRYATYEHEFDGFVIRDPNRIQEFQSNATLGLALNAAADKAICRLLDGTMTREQRDDANLVLSSVKGLQKRLTDRINEQSQREGCGLKQHRSLDSIISQASADATAQPKNANPTIPFGMDR